MYVPRVITIDCETLPAKEELAQLFNPAATPECETVDDARAAAAERCKQSALDGGSGRLLCIGFVDERGAGKPLKGVFGWNHQTESFDLSEAALLTDFWELMRDFRTGCDRIVGHNILNFDLPFIYQRSIICGVRPTIELPFRRYSNQPIYDTMCEWEKWNLRRKISLDRLARLLHLPSPKSDEANGSRIPFLYAEGNHRAIRDYCLRDVETARLIYRRLGFIPDPPACAPSLRANEGCLMNARAALN